MNQSGPVAAQNASGTKLHLQHGPIDLIITADGPSESRQRAFGAAEAALADVLETLVAELAELRRPASEWPVVRGPVACRMVNAATKFAARFLTPMAAVAGAVADHVVAQAMDPQLDRLTVNNGGDIAFALAAGASTTIGLVDATSHTHVSRRMKIHASDPTRGVATSGWRGRSHSLGIADAVTTFAACAAHADAAASVIASAVDLPDHASIERVPARELDEDSDLGDRLVTIGVAGLSASDRRQALAAGEDVAVELLEAGHIHAVLAVLGDDWFAVEAPAVGLLGRVQAEIRRPPFRLPC